MTNLDWLVKPRTASLFLSASAMVILGAALLLFLDFADARTISFLETSTVFRVFAGVVGVVAAPSAIYLFVGMLWFWARVDDSPRLVKALWLILFIGTGFLALAFYSLFVYRRQVTRQAIAGANT